MNIFTFTYNKITVDYVSIIYYSNTKKLNRGDTCFSIDYMTDDPFYIAAVWNPKVYKIL